MNAITSTQLAKAGEVTPGPGGTAYAGPFLVTPPRIHFDSFKVDTECVASLLLRNQDSVSRSIRVIPPSSRFFSMDQPAYPGRSRGEGVIAPGMALRVTVRFLPNSPAECYDALTVVTERGAFKVPLSAALPPPLLSLPLDVNAGCCLRGDEITTSFTVENHGLGDGRYGFGVVLLLLLLLVCCLVCCRWFCWLLAAVAGSLCHCCCCCRFFSSLLCLLLLAGA